MSKVFYSKSSILIFFLCLFSIERIFPQQINHTLNRDFLWGIDAFLNSKEENQQTFIKPYRYADFNKIEDSILFFPPLIKKKVSVEKDTHKFNVEISPIVTAIADYQFNEASKFPNDLAIGGNLVCTIGKKFAVNIKAIGGKMAPSGFEDSIIKQTNVVPGLGYAYLSNGEPLNPHFAYQYYSGYLSYSPNRIFNFQVGQDKHFWGDGYRSLFLSDNSVPYPYFKITTNVWKLTYVNLYTIMKDVTNPSGFKSDWYNKYSTLHYLGWNVSKRINIGLFESIVWQGSDSVRYRGYDVNYLNPIMFFRPTEYSLGSSDNALEGISFKIKLLKKQQLYGQFLLDEFLIKEIRAQNGWWGNKYGIQCGFKSFDLFGINHFNFQLEYNYVRPYTYSHGSVMQNYGNYNQPLAHPLGANFSEGCAFLNYRFKRLFAEFKFIYSVYGADSAGTDYGKNIFISYTKRNKEYNNVTGQGFQTSLLTSSVRLAYVLDARMNLKLEGGFVYRQLKTDYASQNTPYVYIGLRTDLCNLYNDY